MPPDSGHTCQQQQFRHQSAFSLWAVPARPKLDIRENPCKRASHCQHNAHPPPKYINDQSTTELYVVPGLRGHDIDHALKITPRPRQHRSSSDGDIDKTLKTLHLLSIDLKMTNNSATYHSGSRKRPDALSGTRAQKLHELVRQRNSKIDDRQRAFALKAVRKDMCISRVNMSIDCELPG